MPQTRPDQPDLLKLAGVVLLVLACTLLAAGLTQRVWDWRSSGHVVQHDGGPLYQVNVNTADAATLQLLPGIGPKVAENLLADRATHGLYRSLNDLDRVRLIGPATLQRIGPWVRFDDPVSAAPRGE